MNTEALKQFALETGRVVMIALVSYFATDLVIAQVVEAFAGETLSEVVKLQITAFISVVVKAIDRSLHESKIAEKGITRF